MRANFISFLSKCSFLHNEKKRFIGVLCVSVCVFMLHYNSKILKIHSSQFLGKKITIIQISFHNH